jgi:hypothetical protein
MDAMNFLHEQVGKVAWRFLFQEHTGDMIRPVRVAEKLHQALECGIRRTILSEERSFYLYAVIFAV